MLFLDFETRSPVDLKKAGSGRYTRDLRTEIICCAVLAPPTPDRVNGQLEVWRNPRLFPFTENAEARQLLEEDHDWILAHNAAFDRAIYEHVAVPRYDFPTLSGRWMCTATQARLNALPASLANCGRLLRVPQQKMSEGAALIRQLCIPRYDGYYNEDKEALEDLVAYCCQDLRATLAIAGQMRPPTDDEYRDYLVSEAINDRGVRVDTAFAAAAMSLAVREKRAMDRRIRALTDGAVRQVTQLPRLVAYTVEALGLPSPDAAAPPALEPFAAAMRTVRDDGSLYWGLSRPARAELLRLHEEGEATLPGDLYEVIAIAHSANRSSVAKYASIKERAYRGRIYDAFVFAGAAQTQRFSSQGLQLHNLRRDCVNTREEFDSAYQAVRQGTVVHANDETLFNTLSRMLRPTIMAAPGNVLVCADWSAIEARALPWLAGADEVLDVFRAGGDIYLDACARMGIEDRQIGKVAVLSLGYGGGVRAFQFMARNYGVTLPEHEIAHHVARWRETNPWARAFWDSLTDSALGAMSAKGTRIGSPVAYSYDERLNGTLCCHLPGDVTLQYTAARVQDTPRGVALTAIKPSRQPKVGEPWPRMTLWHGLLVENVTQAVCAKLLRVALSALHDRYPVVMHTHDEIVLEVPEEQADDARAALEAVMCTPPEWAPDLPLAVESYVTTRYGVKK